MILFKAFKVPEAGVDDSAGDPVPQGFPQDLFGLAVFFPGNIYAEVPQVRLGGIHVQPHEDPVLFYRRFRVAQPVVQLPEPHISLGVQRIDSGHLLVLLDGLGVPAFYLVDEPEDHLGLEVILVDLGRFFQVLLRLVQEIQLAVNDPEIEIYERVVFSYPEDLLVDLRRLVELLLYDEKVRQEREDLQVLRFVLKGFLVLPLRLGEVPLRGLDDGQEQVRFGVARSERYGLFKRLRRFVKPPQEQLVGGELHVYLGVVLFV